MTPKANFSDGTVIPPSPGTSTSRKLPLAGLIGVNAVDLQVDDLDDHSLNHKPRGDKSQGLEPGDDDWMKSGLALTKAVDIYAIGKHCYKYDATYCSNSII